MQAFDLTCARWNDAKNEPEFYVERVTVHDDGKRGFHATSKLWGCSPYYASADTAARQLAYSNAASVRKVEEVTPAMMAQDAYAQAARDYDRSATSLRWALEDKLGDEDPVAMAACRANHLAKADALRAALDAFMALTDAERASVGLRDPRTD